MKKSFVDTKDRPYQSLQSHTLQSMHQGFNYFHQIDLSYSVAKPRAKSLLRKRSSTIKTENSVSNKDEIKQMLQQNKIKLQNLKTQIQTVRDLEFNEYIKKSLRYQQLLSINDTKKKRLPTLNVKIGEVVKKALFDQQKNYEYDATFLEYKVDGWKPQLREGHTCITYKDNIIVIGGHCSYPFSAINIFSIQHNMWLKGFEGGSARSYHTSLLYRSRFVINFGGMGSYNPARKCRQCFNSINLIDLSSHTSKIIKIQNQELIEPRRSHAAVLMGKHMVVFGGMNTKKQYLNDLVYLDLKELRWYHKEYTVLDEHFERFLSSGLSKHRAITVFKPRKKFPLYSADYSEWEGIYLFGGYNQQGQDNVVSQITFNRYIPVMKRINYIGAPPSSKDPLLQKFNDSTIVIVSGDQYQRELNLFKVKEQKFIQVTYTENGNKIMLGGLGSSLAHFKNSYFVFYGLGKDGYIDAIGSFNLNETVKQVEAKKKKKSMHGEWKNFFQTIHSKTDSRASLSQNIDEQYGLIKSHKK